MNTDIRYHGYTAQPSDYQAPDGDLTLSLNLINETGEITPISQPVERLQIIPGMSVYYIHTTSSNLKNYILYQESTNSFFSTPVDSHTVSLSLIKTFPENEKIFAITGIGNSLSFATSAGIAYVIFRESKYVFLGNKPPFIPLEFALQKECNFGTIPEKIMILDSDITADMLGSILPNYQPGYSRPHRPSGITDLSKANAVSAMLSDAVFGGLYNRYKECTKDKILFYQPFFVRYAFRLFDGSYCWHSAPVLMLPTTVPPVVTCGEAKLANGVYENTAIYSRVNLFSLQYRILEFKDLSIWKDIIAGIDIFISAPIYTYDQSGTVSLGTLTYKSYNRDVSPTIIPGSRVPSRSRDPGTRSDCYRIEGIYGTNINETKPQWQQAVAPEQPLPIWELPSREKEMLGDIETCHEFYLAAQLDFSELISSSQFVELNYSAGFTIDSLVNRPTLKDEFQSHHLYSPRLLTDYNSRLDIGDIDIQLSAALPLRSLTCCCAPTSYTTTYTVHSSKIIYSKDYTRFSSFSEPLMEDNSLIEQSPSVIDSLLEQRPIFLYVHDPDATELHFLVSKNEFPSQKLIISFPLKRHGFLNGAYYFSGFTFDIDRIELSSVPGSSLDDDSPNVVHRPNRIYLSEVNNPFVFSAENMTTVGSGRILALSSAAKALSQGQFGQFPLYAFTTEGVWALEISATGSYSARQPITRDVCINPDGITQIDSAVLFPTDRGIMLLSGSDTLCISDPINNTISPADISALPHINALLDMTMVQNDHLGLLSDIPLIDFLRDCRMLYDYPHQRIIVFNPNVSYGYVYSLQTKLWGMMYTDISYPVNSYPEALAVTNTGQLVDFSANGGEIPPQLLLTRPLSFDIPNTLKTISAVIQRGDFRRGMVRSVLYGSRDLVNWHLVWSSKDHSIRGFSGTPYKYFRIALLCNFTQNDSLYGATVQYTPRYTNRLR